MEWQPIETAPKDGTKILVFCKPDEIFTATWGKWTDAHFNDWKATECWCVYDCEDAFYSHLLSGDRVKYWHPLPEPPKMEDFLLVKKPMVKLEDIGAKAQAYLDKYGEE